MKHTKAIMSGERSGLLASCLRAALLPASWGYGLGARWKNRGFDLGTVKVHRCGVPVISVGNVTTGGTGKTPVVCYLAQKIRQQGLRVAIVSRGYRSDADTGVNDEALELHDRLPDVPHVQDPDRVEAARVAVEELESEIILMDDGFQHRRLGRDLDIVLIDATCPFGFGHLLPRGLLREPLSSLGRADLIVISRCDQVDSTQLDRIRSVVQGIAPETPVIESEHRPSSLRGCRGDLTASDLLQGQTVALISGIGNPDAFQRTVEACGGDVIGRFDLPDHDPYTGETVRRIDDWARQLSNPPQRLICTHKDLVKLRTDRLGGLPMSALQIDWHPTLGAEVLDRMVTKVCDANATQS